MRGPLRSLLLGWLAAAFLLGGVNAQAAMIGTEAALAAQARAADVEPAAQVDAFMARQDVRAQFEAWGVAPELAAERVAQLSDAELQRLAAHIESQPAGGGALAVIGVVFLVLLILELVGVTNVFNRI